MTLAKTNVADSDAALPDAVRREAAAWAAAVDTPVPAGLDSTQFCFRPHPDWEAAERVFRETTGFEGRDDPARLIPAFGSSAVGNDTHRRLCWLCVNAARMVRHCWDEMAENPDARDALEVLAAHLRGAEVDLDPLTEPAVAVRDGRRVSDCDACRVEPVAAAVATAALFALHADVNDAGVCLQHVQAAADEGCWWDDASDARAADRPFAAWFVAYALPASWRCEELPSCAPGVPVWEVVRTR